MSTPGIDDYWRRELRPLPIRIAPLPGELLISFVRRLAHANRTDSGLLVRHLAGDYYHGMQQVRTHDLVLNHAARRRLAIFSGYPEPVLRTVLATRRHFQDGDPQPARHWDAFSIRDVTVVRPCSRCAARRGARIPALVRIGVENLAVCVRHRRTLVHYRDEQRRDVRGKWESPPVERSMDAFPEILKAVRRHHALRRRRRDTVDAALAAAAQITSQWHSWPGRRGEMDAIALRWKERSRSLLGVSQRIVRHPETIALTALFFHHPALIHTPRGGTGDPSPMVFLLHAARYLEHPRPEWLLHRHHPLFRWAGAEDLPRWRWANVAEPDRTIYADLRAGDLAVDLKPLALVAGPHPPPPK